MHVIDIENGRDGYVKILEHVWDHGKIRQPRGTVTVDAGPTTIIVRDINNALPIGVGRGVSPKVAAIEALQLVAGVSVPKMVVRASPHFEKYREPTGRFHGAYGVRIGDQVEHIINKFKTDRDTRQAVATLWNPMLDNLSNMKDYPCTVALHFAIIDDKLIMSTVMRSNDAWLGIPYDIFQFTQLQWSMSYALGIRPGMYNHTALSLHLYRENFDAVEELIASDIDPGNIYQPTGIGTHVDSWSHIKDVARYIINGDSEMEEFTDSEKWYDKHIASIR